MRIWLKEKRDQRVLTQQQVAEMCGISRSYYAHIENGTKTPTVKVAKSIGVTLGFDWVIFFKEECSFREHTA